MSTNGVESSTTLLSTRRPQVSQRQPASRREVEGAEGGQPSRPPLGRESGTGACAARCREANAPQRTASGRVLRTHVLLGAPAGGGGERTPFESHVAGKGWGEVHLEGATPHAGRDWTNNGRVRDERQLKHRGAGEGRTVPLPPELVALLREHLAEYGTSPDGRLFRGKRAAELPKITYLRAWRRGCWRLHLR